MKLLHALCRSSQGILKQKLGLLRALEQKHGAKTAKDVFQTPCPIVKASIGQHFRHSMDHIEPVVHIATASHATLDMGLVQQQHDHDQDEIHYDLRQRGGADEYDWDAATDRIQRVHGMLEELSSSSSASSAEPNEKVSSVLRHPVKACFMLSGDDDQEYPLDSSVAREVGFAVHHAIHHLALVRIIATNQVGGLTDADLPSDFGRAPSTVNFDRSSA